MNNSDFLEEILCSSSLMLRMSHISLLTTALWLTWIPFYVSLPCILKLMHLHTMLSVSGSLICFLSDYNVPL
jgi:hypothetical protein